MSLSTDIAENKQAARAPVAAGATQDEAVLNSMQSSKADQASLGTDSRMPAPTNAWDRLTSWIRERTPASIINNGSRINFGLKAVADGMGIASALGFRLTKNAPKGVVKSWPRFWANVVTSATLVPGLLYKEKPVAEETIEHYKSLSTPAYVWQKLKDAFDPKDHIVETVSLATVLNGVLSSLAGFKQSNFRGFSPLSKASWGNISMEFITGIFTTVAGATLGLIPNRERAWQVSTATFTWRIPFKATQAYNAMFKGYPNASPPVAPGDPFQLINFFLQQTANIFGFFFAGIKKTEDGQIIRLGKDEEHVDVDKEKIRGYNYKPEKKHRLHLETESGTPSTSITSVVSAERAMPERAEAQREAAVVS